MKLLVSRSQKFAGVTNLRGLHISSVATLALEIGSSLMMCVDGGFSVRIQVHSVAWNCYGQRLASGNSVDQTARIWHVEPHGHV